MFFFFLVISNNFLTIPVVREEIKVKLALTIPTGAPIILVNEIIDTPPVAALKTTKILSIWSKVVTYLLNFLLYDFLWLISSIKYFQFYLFHLTEILFALTGLFY